MAEDWFEDVRKYAPSADPDHVAGIVRYCGIALRRPDSALVAFSSPEETARVRENFLKKKLALSHADSELDAAIAAVGEQMKEDRTKNRVTVYYLLADRFGRLGDFIKAPKSGVAAAAAAAPAESAPQTSAAAADAPELEPSVPAAPSESPASAQPAAPSFAAAAPASPAGFGRRETVGFGNRAAAETSDSGAAAAPAAVADSGPSPTGSRWWLWVLLLIVVLIILFVVLR